MSNSKTKEINNSIWFFGICNIIIAFIIVIAFNEYQTTEYKRFIILNENINILKKQNVELRNEVKIIKNNRR